MGTICFFNTTPFWGGGEKWHLGAAEALRRRGHLVVLVGSPGAPLVMRARAVGIETVEIPLGNRSWLDPVKHRRLRRLFTQHQVDTVILNGPADLKAGGLAARAAGVPKRVYRRGLALPVRGHWLNRYLFTRVVTHVVANSEETRRMVFRDLGAAMPGDRVAVIPNGIDLTDFDRRSHAPVLRGAGDKVVIGAAGRLTRQKDHSTLLDIARLMADEGLEFRLVIAGDGELAGELRDKTRRLGLQGRVEFLGFVEDVPGLMQRTDIFVLTSSWEGFGYVIVEAGAARCPTVAFDVSSNPEVVVDGKTGFLVEPGNVRQFAQRVRTLLEDQDLRERMGAAARADVEARFTQDRAMDELERFLRL